MSNNFDKFAILESFLDEVSSYLPEIQANLDRLQQEPSNSDVIEETYRRAHTIAGSAAMMEYSALAHVAQGMEDSLGDALDAQTPIDQPAIGLLRRSFTRLSRLIEHIRSGEDDAPIVAEDDADRAALRGSAAVASTSGAHPADFAATSNGASSGMQDAGPSNGRDASASSSLQIPDWLAAFAGPAAGASAENPPAPQQGPDLAVGAPNGDGSPVSDYWTGPVEPPQPPNGYASQSFPAYQPAPADRGVSPDASVSPGAPYASSHDSYYGGGQGLGSSFQASTASPEHAANESFEDILRSFQAGSAQPHGEPETPAYAPPPTGPLPGAPAPYAVSGLGASALPTMPPSPQSSPYASSPARSAAPAAGSLVPALSELRADEEAVRRQVATLRDITASLRDAAQAMEDERVELRSFLDGSRDALERLENWAGQQMGLDLRHSPDSVRRYLPLSVIWVTTTRLKQLVTLLKSSDRGLTTTQEQIEETLNELRSAIESTGQIYSTMSTIAGPPDTGFSATVAQFSWAPPAPPALAAQSSVDALSSATRAELERTVRDQLRRELEDEVRAEVAAEVRHDEEDRLRQELQIQVRRQLLSELSPSLGASSLPVPSAGDVLPGMLLSSERAPKPVQVTSDQSPEAQEVFREEAQEHLQTITTGIAQLETTPGDISVLQSIRRAMHTLKGAAGMMGFTAIQQLAHASEDLLDRFVEEGASLTPNVMSLLLDTSEALDQLVGNLSASPSEQQQLLRSLTDRYAEVIGPSDSGAGLAAGNVVSVAGEEPEEPVDARTTGETTPDLSVRLQLSKLDDLVNLFGELLINRSILEERIDRLNRLVTDTVVVGERLREVGGQLETRFEAATLPSGRGSLPLTGSAQPRDPAASWAPSTPRAISGGLQQTPQFAHEFDELELDRYTEFHRLSRGLSEGVADAVTLSHEMETLIRECQTSFARENRLTSDFQDRLLKARLVPLQSLVPRLYRTARASALREGKDIEFYAEGMDTEVDRKVFEELAGPLLHIVRNAVNHAIERPDVREMEGKARAGRILVSAAYEGNQVVIAVRDDGAGINPNKIRETAIARGWIDPYTNLTEKEALNLIFQPGVSTAETVTEESGRGVGLDVVRDTVSRLRGTVEVESSVGQGTIFTMKFPISLQIARAVLVRVGTQTLAIPMAVVDQIGRLDYYQKIPGATPAIELRGERYPLAHLASYLKLQQGPIDERSSILLVNAGKRRVALLVDSIVAQQEIVSKPLGPHLREVQGVAGAAVLGNGQVILILEMHELLAQQPRGAVVLPPPAAATPPPPPAAPPVVASVHSAPTVTQLPTAPMPAFSGAASVQSVTAPTAVTPAPSIPAVSQTSAAARRDFVVAQRPPTGTLPNRTVVPPIAQNSYVLVVDDSPSVRRVVSNMLKAHGWEVQAARDGVEALEIIARQMPAAVLLDIEMPRMDGYELMATVRSQEQYRYLPLIVLTSRAATKHQQRALQLGADAYVVKPYQDEELLGTIATLVQARR